MSTGRFIWHDLMTNDVDAAKGFYAGVFGWTTRAHDGEQEMPYTVIDSGYGDAAGIMDLKYINDDNVPPNWMPYVSTDDVEATCAKLQELGGQVLASGSGDGMDWATIQSDEGAVMGIVTMEESPERDGEPRSGEFCWYSLGSSDPAAAQEFWTQLFGWTCEEIDLGGEKMMVFSHGDTQIADLTPLPPGVEHPFWGVAVAVENLEGTLEMVAGNKGNVLMPPMPVGEMGRMAMIADPTGAMLTIFQSN